MADFQPHGLYRSSFSNGRGRRYLEAGLSRGAEKKPAASSQFGARNATFAAHAAFTDHGVEFMSMRGGTDAGFRGRIRQSGPLAIFRPCQGQHAGWTRDFRRRADYVH
jgi:hypothetical protein